jgi:hypothetical protein
MVAPEMLVVREGTMMPDTLKPVAKAVAAFLAPFVVAIAVWLSGKLGTPINVDLDAATAGIVAIVGAAWVYFTRNRQA